MNKQKGWEADDDVMLIVPGSGFEPCVSLSAHHFRIRTTRPGLRKPRAVNFFFFLKKSYTLTNPFPFSISLLSSALDPQPWIFTLFGIFQKAQVTHFDVVQFQLVILLISNRCNPLEIFFTLLASRVYSIIFCVSRFSEFLLPILFAF